MKAQTKTLVIGGLILAIGAIWYWTNIATKSSSSTKGLLGKKVTAKYTGASQPDLGIGGADMVSPLKNGQTLEGTITADGLYIMRSGGIAGRTPATIPNGEFEVISLWI
jgi:hypothetical protein